MQALPLIFKAMLRVIGLNRVTTMLKIKMLLAFTLLATVSLTAHAAPPLKAPKNFHSGEVYILSLQFNGEKSATIVARPCDAYIKCKNILVRIDEKSTLRDFGEEITHKQAKKLNWEFALLIVDKRKNVLFLDRIPIE